MRTDETLSIFKGTEAFSGVIASSQPSAAAAGAIAGQAVVYAIASRDNAADRYLPGLVFIILVCTIFAPSMYLIHSLRRSIYTNDFDSSTSDVETLGSEDYILSYRSWLWAYSWPHVSHPLAACRMLLLRQATDAAMSFLSRLFFRIWGYGAGAAAFWAI